MSLWTLMQNGLSPQEELARHKKLASEYRIRLSRFTRKTGWRYRLVRDSAIFHEQEAARLLREMEVDND